MVSLLVLTNKSEKNRKVLISEDVCMRKIIKKFRVQENNLKDAIFVVVRIRIVIRI